MSTTFTGNQSHLVHQGRTSSRVLAPPGGKTSIVLGYYEPDPPKPKQVVPSAVAMKPNPSESNDSSKDSTPVSNPPVVVNTAANEGPATTNSPTTEIPQQNLPITMPPSCRIQDQPVSANAFASGARMNGANVMTGRPTSRVLAPPGGFTSIKLG